jgi:hypothetical protein
VDALPLFVEYAREASCMLDVGPAEGRPPSRRSRTSWRSNWSGLK